MQNENAGTSEPILRCAYSGVELPASRMVQIGEHWISADKKDECVQYLQQGGTLPVVPAGSEPTAPRPQLLPVWDRASHLFARAFPVMLGLHLVVWLPAEIFSSYMTFHVIGEEDLGRSFRLENAIQLWIGIIADAGGLHALAAAWRGRRAGFGESMLAGFRHWPRMWFMNFLWRLAVIAGILLLVIPGILVMVRCVFASCYVVDADRKATDSLASSYSLCRGHFWRVTGCLLLTVLIACIPFFCLATAVAFLPENWDTWQLDAAITWVGTIPMLFVPAVVYVLWQSLRQLSATSAGVHA